MVLDPLEELRRRGLLQEQGRGADPHREEQQAAEAEGEGSGGEPQKTSSGSGFRT